MGVIAASTIQEAWYVDRSFLSFPVAIAALGSGVLPLRNRLPLSVGVITASIAGSWGTMLPLLVALFHLAARGKIKESVACTVGALGLSALIMPPINLGTPRAYGPTLLFGLAVALGLWANSRRRLTNALAKQVEHLRSERELGETAARAAERATVATEMHDVLAHRLSLIALHAGVLNTRAEQLPPQVADRVALLRTAAKDALSDLRDVLGALRAPESDAEPPLAPTLRELDELLADSRVAGQRIDSDVTGAAIAVPAAHQLAVYRVVRESLTNARKYAPEATVTVRVGYGPPVTAVEITNALPARAVTDVVPAGFGLVGLHERVEALGGTLSAGVTAGGAWRVAARLPFHQVGETGSDQNGTPS